MTHSLLGTQPIECTRIAFSPIMEKVELQNWQRCSFTVSNTGSSQKGQMRGRLEIVCGIGERVRERGRENREENEWL